MLVIETAAHESRGSRALRAYNERLAKTGEELSAADIGNLAVAWGDMACMTVAAHLVASESTRLGMTPYRNMPAAMAVPEHHSDYGVLLPLETRSGMGVKYDRDGTTTREAIAQEGLALVSEIHLPKHLQGPHAKHNVALMGIAVSLQHRSASLY